MLLRNLSWCSEYKSLSIFPRRYDVDDMGDGWVLSTSQGSLRVEMPFRSESQMQSLQGYWASELNYSLEKRSFWQQIILSDYQKQLWASWGRSVCWSLSPGSCRALGEDHTLCLLPPRSKLVPAFTLFSVLCLLFHLLKSHPDFKINFKFSHSSLWQLQPALVTQLSNLFHQLDCSEEYLERLFYLG